MADEKKKGLKAIEVFYYIFITLAVLAFCIFGYMKLADMELLILDRLIGCYTICFTAVTVFMLVRILLMYNKAKKIGYQMWLMIIACVVSGVCLINSVAEDSSKTKVKGIIKVNDATKVLLCEITQKNGHTKIDVYRVRDRMAKKLGEIDEKPFSVRCVAEKKYDHYLSDNQDIITIVCNYEKYYDEMVELKPEYDKGYLEYSFALE